MNANRLYPLADFYQDHMTASERANLRARYTGETRTPRAGEWYLSGAIPEAYQAAHDLSMAFHIAQIVKVKVLTIEVITDTLP